MAYYDKMKGDMMMTTGPDAIMKYGGGCGCGKRMPKYSNNPKTMQGRKLRAGGAIKSMKTYSMK